MDFESCLSNCCMPCNSSCSNFKTSPKIRGQGDYKDSIDFHSQQINWERGNNIRNKYQEEEKFGFREEQQKKQFNTYCSCFCKNKENEDFLDKIRHEAKYEKSNIEIFQNYKTPWNSSYGNWSKNNIKESNMFEDFRSTEHSNPDKLVTETISELKEKVEFLFKNFKESNPKVFYDSCCKQQQGDNARVLPRDIPYLFNLSNRLSVVEKDIQTLTLILEDYLQDPIKRKASSAKSPAFSEPLNFDEMSVPEKINLLKSRIDFLVTFIRNFLRVRSAEELNSVLDLMQRDNETSENAWNSTFCFVEGDQTNNLNQKDVLETLNELRLQVAKENKEVLQNSNEDYATRHEKRRENAAKYYRNKLEVISEQAELAFYYDNEHENSNEFRSRKTNGNLSSEERHKNTAIPDKTARLLAQEAMLKLSLDRADFDMISNGDSSEKSGFPSQSRTLTNRTSRDENTGDGIETSSDSSRRSLFWETENKKTTKVNITKHRCHEESKKETKKERKVEPPQSNLPKRTSVSSKKTIQKPSDAKQQSNKLLKQKSHTLLAPTVLQKQNTCCLPEICSFSREETKKETRTKIQRPLSTPGMGTNAKSHQPSAPAPEKNRKKNSGINNVKNKNKLLLSQKSCVRTA